MDIEIKVPVLPESITEATLVNWKKQPGEVIEQGELLIEIETDKVVLEVVALQDGVMGEIIEPDGSIVGADQLIGRMIGGAKAIRTASSVDASASADATRSVQIQGLSPAVRKLVQENNIDPVAISGSGRDGRILKEDVISYLAPKQSQGAKVEAVAAVAVRADERTEERVPMTRIRARIAERLVEAQQTAAILTTFNEVDMKPVMDLRNKYKAEFEKRHQSRLGFMSFFVKASVEALRRYPLVNASIDGNDVIYHGYYDIGVAVSSPRGLVVPILRNAESMSFATVENNIAAFGQKAKDNKLTLEDLQGGTFTISNGGTFGSMLSTPILNPPQSAILGMHNIVERAVVIEGEILIRPVMYLALSYDHRIIDGREAVTFLVAIKQALEDPARLLLEI